MQLVSTQLFSALHRSSPVRSSHLISSQPISDFRRFSRLFSTLLSSPQLMSAHLISSHLFPPLLSAHLSSSLAQNTLHFPPSSTLYYMTRAKYFPVLLCIAKLAETTSQYYFVLRSLHKACSSTTPHHKGCTKHFPKPLCTAKLRQSTSLYYFVLPKLPQSTSQHYFVL